MLGITALVLVLLFGAAAGRVAVVTAAVEAAARDAARQASISRAGSAAGAKARESAQESLRSQGVSCMSVDVRVDTGGFGRPVGTPATVSASVSCTVPLSDLAFPGLPGSVVRRATFTSPLDPYRGRAVGLVPVEALVGAVG
ncbi:hypothetical protein GCM10010466_08710 [Planomonospora alba]|uniref:Pilus assembly protein n=2 Tax=Planomonospora alba TaxID=161354 RepID=A0ABP6MN43_9ACTN